FESSLRSHFVSSTYGDRVSQSIRNCAFFCAPADGGGRTREMFALIRDASMQGQFQVLMTEDADPAETWLQDAIVERRCRAVTTRAPTHAKETIRPVKSTLEGRRHGQEYPHSNARCARAASAQASRRAWRQDAHRSSGTPAPQAGRKN